MEELVPFIIGIGIYIYKIWSNFRTEQEKAAKRDPSIPVESESARKKEKPMRYPSQKVVPPVAEPFLLIEEQSEAKNRYEPKYKHLYQRDAMAKSKEVEERIYRAEKPVLADGRNPEPISDEVDKNRRIHHNHNHSKLKVELEDESVYHFDMRDAIIKEAILNRPNF